MNSQKYMPFESIAPLIFRDEENPDFPFFSGTGFFVKFNPFKKIFLVTAKHCVLTGDDKPYGKLEIKLNPDPQCNKAIPFNLSFFGNLDDDEFPEDVVVYEVGELEDNDRRTLEKRALSLLHQEDVENILKKISKNNEKVRIIGYPSTSKNMDYDNNLAKTQPRGIVGTVTHADSNFRFIKVENINWKEGSLEGFSGSPVIGLFKDIISKKVLVAPIGVVSTGNKNTFHFTSINIATDLIAKHLSIGLKRPSK